MRRFALLARLALAVVATGCQPSASGSATPASPARPPSPADSPPPAPAPTPASLDEASRCTADADCVVVPYFHCCGLQYRAVRTEWRELYLARKDWNTFDDPDLCSRIGACPEREPPTSARCVEGTCAAPWSGR